MGRGADQGSVDQLLNGIPVQKALPRPRLRQSVRGFPFPEIYPPRLTQNLRLQITQNMISNPYGYWRSCRIPGGEK